MQTLNALQAPSLPMSAAAAQPMQAAPATPATKPMAADTVMFGKKDKDESMSGAIGKKIASVITACLMPFGFMVVGGTAVNMEHNPDKGIVGEAFDSTGEILSAGVHTLQAGAEAVLGK